MSAKKIVVLGDITLDENIYKGERNAPDQKGQGTFIRQSRGGAYLLYEILNTLMGMAAEHVELGEPPACVFVPELGVESIPVSLKSYALWRKNQNKDAMKPKEKWIHWEMESALGYGSLAAELKESKASEADVYTGKDNASALPSAIDVLVLDDSGSYFHQADELWNAALAQLSPSDQKSHPWVILKTGYPLARGNLFRKLTSEHQEHLVIVTSIDELRKDDALISKGTSWEQTALDLVYELSANRTLQRLLQCRHLIITLQSEGVLYVENDANGMRKCRLLFNPECMEGEHTESFWLEVIGSMSCFTAAIAYAFTEAEINVDAMLTSGLSAMVQYRSVGHISCDDKLPEFPYSIVCQAIREPLHEFSSAFVPIPTAQGSFTGVEFRKAPWTILEGNYTLDSKMQPLYDLGLQLALNGEEVLTNTPYLTIGDLTTYDRREIEAIRNLKNLIREYCKHDKGKKPLSLAVFGTPGSGKSFAVKQLSRQLGMEFLEFNLSQFSNEGELEGAFHQVRDKVLEGVVPCVFWDEFDSQNYRWLQFLLAPMQDGKFQEGQITHPIGKCVFVFAGGTSYSFETFGAVKPVMEGQKGGIPTTSDEYSFRLARYQEFKLLKGPDFKSRLHGYLNVQGPNPCNRLNAWGDIETDQDGNEINDPSDIFFPIRRALFIRQILGVKKQKLNIDPGLLYALIHIPKFKHGSRTLEYILRQLKTQGQTPRFLRSSLPAADNLAVFVDYNRFLNLMQEDHTADFRAYVIAPLIHQNWCDIGDKEGYRLEYHKPFKRLPTHLQQENIEAAKRIPSLLEVVGLMAVPAGEAEFYAQAEEKMLEVLEKGSNDQLAKLEHEGWLAVKRNNGWRWDSMRNDDRKQHTDMIDWDSPKPVLSEKVKDKDRDAVSHIPDVLQAAGFRIVRKEEQHG